jgi:hypothetical protein
MVLVVIIVFSIFVYPTPYRYLEYGVTEGSNFPIRTNWITGKTYILTHTKGWEEVKKAELPK